MEPNRSLVAPQSLKRLATELLTQNFQSVNFSSEKIAESGLDGNMTLGETFPTIFEDDKLDLDNCTLSDVIKFLQKWSEILMLLLKLEKKGSNSRHLFLENYKMVGNLLLE